MCFNLHQVDHQSGCPQQLSKLERLAMDVFKSLDCSLYIYASEEKFAKLKPAALKLGMCYLYQQSIFVIIFI